jgi:predicted ArsR family transcriptional regulator
MTSKSRNTNLESMVATTPWSFLSNHARVLICLAEDPDIRLREIGDAVGITERAAHRIVGDLVAAGYVSRERNGRRNRYTVRYDLPLPDPLARGQAVGDLLAIFRADGAERRRARRSSS